MTLYEISLPEPKTNESDGRTKSLKELISAMEQLYSGLLSVETAVDGEPIITRLNSPSPKTAPSSNFMPPFRTENEIFLKNNFLPYSRTRI